MATDLANMDSAFRQILAVFHRAESVREKTVMHLLHIQRALHGQGRHFGPFRFGRRKKAGIHFLKLMRFPGNGVDPAMRLAHSGSTNPAPCVSL